jgi:hypothetical protein
MAPTIVELKGRYSHSICPVCGVHVQASGKKYIVIVPSAIFFFIAFHFFDFHISSGSFEWDKRTILAFISASLLTLFSISFAVMGLYFNNKRIIRNELKINSLRENPKVYFSLATIFLLTLILETIYVASWVWNL